MSPEELARLATVYLPTRETERKVYILFQELQIHFRLVLRPRTVRLWPERVKPTNVVQIVISISSDRSLQKLPQLVVFQTNRAGYWV